jgi:hypothetical protein
VVAAERAPRLEEARAARAARRRARSRPGREHPRAHRLVRLLPYLRALVGS